MFYTQELNSLSDELRRFSECSDNHGHRLKRMKEILLCEENKQPNLIMKEIVQLWYDCIDDRILRRKAAKILEKCEKFFPAQTQDILLQTIKSSLISDVTISKFRSVSHALESSPVVLSCIEKLWLSMLKMVKAGLNIVVRYIGSDQHTPSTTKDISNLDLLSEEGCAVISKIFLQLVQFFPKKVRSSLLCQAGVDDVATLSESPADEQESASFQLAEIFVSLHRLVQCKFAGKDAAIFAGTAFALVAGVCESSRDSAFFIKELFPAKDKSVFSLKIGSLQVSVKETMAAKNPFFALSLANGIVNTVKKDILLCHVHLDRESNPLIMAILPEILRNCDNLEEPAVKYFSFSVLVSWLQCCKRINEDSDIRPDMMVSQLSCSSQTVSEVLRLCYDNAEDQVDGVPQLVQTVFAALLQILQHDNAISEFVERNINQQLDSPWYVKEKYGFLCKLTPYLKYQELTTVSRQVCNDICLECMATCSLPPVCNELYKTLVAGYEKHVHDVDKSLEWWSATWRDPIMTALSCTNLIRRRNVAHYMIPWTLESIPGTYDAMMDFIESKLSTSLPCANPNDRLMYPYAVIMRFSRKFGIITKDVVLKSVMLKQLLTHIDDEVRIEAFSCICSSPKTTEPICTEEDRLIRSFIQDNLNCSQSSFRQKLFVVMKEFLIRIRDGCSVLYRQSYGAKKKTENVVASPSLKLSVEFLDAFLEIIVKALFPGASFQRRRTSLQLFLILMEIYGGGSKRGKSCSVSAGKFISWMESENHMQIFSRRNLLVILTCLEDQHDEVRDIALNILTSKVIDSQIFESFDGQLVFHITKVCHWLLSSPKAQEVESGAAIMEFLVHRFVLIMGYKLQASGKSFAISTCPRNSHEATEDVLQSIDLMLTSYELCIREMEKDTLEASLKSPAFGFLVVVKRFIILLTKTVAAAHKSKIDIEIQQLIDVINRIVKCAQDGASFMLSILSNAPSCSDVDEGVSPSFADIRQALDSILVESASYHTQWDTLGPEQCRDLVLSMCWLNLKSIVLLLGETGNLWRLTEVRQSVYFVTPVGNIAEVFQNCLLNCRHKGVIESAYAGFAKFCKTTKDLLPLKAVMKNWLTTVLESVTKGDIRTSITKRSAGVPFFIQSIIAASVTNDSDNLLSYCMEELLTAAEKPVADVHDHTIDLPQFHAINILKALFRDTALGSEILKFVERGVQLTVEGFSSRIWSIRNACTLLLGTLIPRMFGQKMTQNDAIQQNGVPVREFFLKYPTLEDYFLECLQDHIMATASNSLVGSKLLPVLTILSKLRPRVGNGPAMRTHLAFVDRLHVLLASPVYVVRNLSARALLSFIPRDDFFVHFKQALDQLDDRKHSCNVLHGLLLNLKHFFGNLQPSSDCMRQIIWKQVSLQMERLMILIQCRRMELMTSATLIDTLRIVLEKSYLYSDYSLHGDTPTSFVDRVVEYVIKVLVMHCSPSVRKATVIGHPYFRLKLSKLISLIVLGEKFQIQAYQKEKIITNVFHCQDDDFLTSTLQCIAEALGNEIPGDHDIASFLIQALTLVVSKHIKEWPTETLLLQHALRCLMLLVPLSSDRPNKDLLMEALLTMLIKVQDYDANSRHIIPDLIGGVGVFLHFLVDCPLSEQDQKPVLEGAFVFITILEQYSSPTKVEDLRQAAASSLHISLSSLFQLWQKTLNSGPAITNMTRPPFYKLLLICLYLLEDEDEQIRKTSALAVSTLPGASTLPSLHEASARKYLLGIVSSSVWMDVDLVSGLYDFILPSSWLKTEDTLSEESLDLDRRSLLFQQQGPNLYSEEYIRTRDVISCLSDIVVNLKNGWKDLTEEVKTRINNIFNQKFLLSLELLRHQLKELKSQEDAAQIFGQSGMHTCFTRLCIVLEHIPVMLKMMHDQEYLVVNFQSMLLGIKEVARIHPFAEEKASDVLVHLRTATQLLQNAEYMVN